MPSSRFRLAAALAASTAFLGACDGHDCHDAQGRTIACHGGAGGHGGVFVGGHGGGDDAGVARGGFGGTGDGGGHGGGGGE